jgi:hypothetical protein
MKTLATAALTLLSLTASAQVVVGGKDINTLPELQYIGIALAGSIRPIVAVDMGGDVGGSYDHILGADGKPRKFNTYVEIINFLYQQGWQYAGTYTNVQQWTLLERR